MGLMSIVKEHLETYEIEFQIENEEGRIEFALTDGELIIPLTIRVLESAQQVLVYAYSPVKVPKARRMFVAEFVMRANYGLRLGNFEMDMDDGEIRFKASVDVEEGTLTPHMVRNLIRTCIGLLRKYHPGVLAIAFSDDTNPREEIYRIEEG
jgi:hypothetical protein